jgi:hypothetical protein
MKPKILKLKPILSVEESDKMAGVLLQKSDCKILIDFDADVYDAESGKCIAKFRKKVIPPHIQLAAFNSLNIAAKTSMNRGTSGGKVDGKVNEYKIRSNGKVSKTSEAAQPVDSGIVGYFDRNPRMPFCRLTAFNQQHFEKFKKAYPIIKFVDKTYQQLMPEHYARQRSIADKTSQDFVIKDTSFTTVTVNKNWQTAVHKDKGDFADGFGNLVALRKGKYLGGYFVVVRWGVGFDLQNGDLLLVDVHQWHGNTPIIKDNKKVIRLSLVMYYREQMKNCGTMAQELDRAKNRKKGDPVKGKLTIEKHGKETKHQGSNKKANNKTSVVKRRGVDKKDIRKK